MYIENFRSFKTLSYAAISLAYGTDHLMQIHLWRISFQMIMVFPNDLKIDLSLQFQACQMCFSIYALSWAFEI